MGESRVGRMFLHVFMRTGEIWIYTTTGRVLRSGTDVSGIAQFPHGARHQQLLTQIPVRHRIGQTLHDRDSMGRVLAGRHAVRVSKASARWESKVAAIRV